MAWRFSRWLSRWPICLTDQVIFAEALSQALAAGLDPIGAINAAAGVVRSPRFRAALGEMAANCERGYTLAESLSRTKVFVDGELLAALAVGEERGDLPGWLAAFARRHEPRPGRRLAASVGRRPEVTRFAAALARLLKDRPLTVPLIEDAARLAAGEGSPFALAVGRLAEAMCEGVAFSEALATEESMFDPFFCALVAVPEQRGQLRAVLARVGEASEVQPDSALNPART